MYSNIIELGIKFILVQLNIQIIAVKQIIGLAKYLFLRKNIMFFDRCSWLLIFLQTYGFNTPFETIY